MVGTVTAAPRVSVPSTPRAARPPFPATALDVHDFPMSTEPVIHRKRRRVMIVAGEPPAALAPAVAKANAPRPLLKPRALSPTPAERKASRLPLGCSPPKLALSAWTASDADLEAAAAGGACFNLAGEVEGEVTPRRRAHATRKPQRRRDAAARLHEVLPGDAAPPVAPHVA